MSGFLQRLSPSHLREASPTTTEHVATTSVLPTDVAAENQPEPGARVWIFQANPQQYDLAERLKSMTPGTRDLWAVSSYGKQMQPSDTVIFWQSGRAAGIYALGTLLGTPRRREEWQEEQSSVSDGNEPAYYKIKYAVEFEYTRILERPIAREVFVADPVLSQSEIIRIPRGTNFKVTADEWERVQALLAEPTLQEPPLSAFDRGSEESARQVFERLYPDAAIRRVCLTTLANAIETAHRQGTGSWGVTLFPQRVALNVGRIYGCGLRKDEASLAIDMTTLGEEGVRRTESQQVKLSAPFKVAPTVVWAQVPPDHLVGVSPLLASAHERAIEIAAATVHTRTPFHPFHSPGVLAYLSHELGRPMPTPEYGEERQAPTRRPAARASVPAAHAIARQPSRAVHLMLAAALAAEGLHYTQWQVASFYTGLQVKGFVILSGISGTGKTKLGQRFASLLPQPALEDAPVEGDVITLTVRPYMRKYARMTIPKYATRMFDPPPPGEKCDVLVRFNEEAQECTLVHAAYTNTDYIEMHLLGKARRWLLEDFAEGDTLTLTPDIDADQRFIGFTLAGAMTQSPRPTSPEQVSNDSAEAGAALPALAASNCLFIPVRPDWRDSKSLLGYFNPLSGTYEWTPFLRLLLRAGQSYRARDGLAWFVLLDEMNLARVEYYFADLLSVLESGRTEEGWTREPLRPQYPEDAEGDLPPRALYLPSNLYIVGTVNMDETTYAFSPKVLDRAFTLELSDVSFADYPPVPASTMQGALSNDERRALQLDFTQEGTFAHIDKDDIGAYVAAHHSVRARLQNLNDLLQPYYLHFGYRVFDEIVSFLAAAERNRMFADEGHDQGELAALDAAALMKVLPKFHGSRAKLEDPLRAVAAWCLDPDHPARDTIDEAFRHLEADMSASSELATLPYALPRTAERVQRMLRTLITDGFSAAGL